ncbi:hypothetical protein HanRHA438_Chr15g0721631 [Helianthus annuus]|nr:hypothetical protein HanIR_Chr15g0771691 [Helianthus annuus]KAJ0832645.1 hypothetical protein HanPSC8_Chr15g0681051 [Helianthus annuus]KAJ0846154.1 hypothetical protein HanRHA438_Chr15g0721631 [Helianthus annuus]
MTRISFKNSLIVLSKTLIFSVSTTNLLHCRLPHHQHTQTLISLFTIRIVDPAVHTRLQQCFTNDLSPQKDASLDMCFKNESRVNVDFSTYACSLSQD